MLLTRILIYNNLDFRIMWLSRWRSRVWMTPRRLCCWPRWSVKLWLWPLRISNPAILQTLEYNGLPQVSVAVNKIGLAGLTDSSSSSDQSGGFLSGASALIGQLGQLVSPGPGFDTVNRLGEAASTESGELDITKKMFSSVRQSQCLCQSPLTITLFL